MDYQSTNIIEIWKDLATLTVNSCNEINNGLQEQTLRLDVIYKKLLQTAQKHSSEYLPDKKISKKLSKGKNGQIVDLFSAEPSFQQPAIPPIRRTKRQASILATDKMKNVRESATISSGASTRASRARAISTFMDIAPIDCPKANSTFVVDKKCLGNLEECLSPEMFSPVMKTGKKLTNPNETYNMPTKSSAITASVENSNPVSIKVGSTEKISESQIKNKRREKLEDIDVNIEKQQSQHMTRTMKRKLQEENQTVAKKTNVIHVPLEKQISTPLKSSEEISQTPHQVRENEAEKRKQIYLKTKADQRKNEDKHLKVAKQKEEQRKRFEEQVRKNAEEKRKREEKQLEKQKEKEIMLKEEALKKQKQAELRIAEINAKRKQAEEAKLKKIEKAEMDRVLKENEMKKKNELKPQKSSSTQHKIGSSNLPSSSIKKIPTLSKSKVKNTEVDKNDYGLNDISARDSSEDESGPKKTVPSWAKRENRKPVLELQYHVDPKERALFFDCPKSMSLREMFKGWNIRDRPRTSSAVWNTPPRFSEYIRRN